MKRKLIINLTISLLIVLVYFLFGYFQIIRQHDPLGIGLFIVCFYSGVYSLIAGVTTIIIVIKKKRNWDNIVFLTSCITNLILSQIMINWVIDLINGIKTRYDIEGLIFICLIPIVCIIQIFLFIKNFRQEYKLK